MTQNTEFSSAVEGYPWVLGTEIPRKLETFRVHGALMLPTLPSILTANDVVLRQAGPFDTGNESYLRTQVARSIAMHKHRHEIVCNCECRPK